MNSNEQGWHAWILNTLILNYVLRYLANLSYASDTLWLLWYILRRLPAVKQIPKNIIIKMSILTN